MSNPIMNTLALYVSFLYLLFANTVALDIPPPYTATEYILLDCGSFSTNSTSPDGRNWEGDSHSKFSPHNIQTTSNASIPTQHDIPSFTQVPYTTARIFPNNFTYSFPLSSGLKFVRLYFYPATYAGVDKSKPFFSVTANNFTLFRNFLAISELEPPAAYVVKEFIIPVLRTQRLNITFKSDLNSYAFINGIEVVSIPNNLYIDNSHGSGITFVDYDSIFYFDGTTALGTMYRLNVGGKDVSGLEDTGMFRTWVNDWPYLIGDSGVTPYMQLNVTIQYTTETPAYTAPEIVYKTFRSMGTNVTANLNSNLTWKFTVDAGFNYLFRLHFCETLPEVLDKNDRVFKIFINNQTAETDADVIDWSHSPGIPVYKDYIVSAPGGNQQKLDLLLALHPASSVIFKPRFEDALLNGVEIFKLNQSDGSFAVLNQDGLVVPTSPAGNEKLTERKKRLPLRIIVSGVVSGVLIATSVICIFIFRRNTRVKDSGSRTIESRSSWVSLPKVPDSTKSHASSLQSHHCRNFLLVEIREATRNFDEKLVVGSGGFGSVYKGYIDGCSTIVAIKRLNASSKQGVREFWAEIELLSQLRHVNLVPLIGYCEDQGEMILVYDFMARGTLREHLQKRKNSPLPWKRRLQICIGAARGLEYLHCGAKNTIIHRDVKSTNILLDEKWVAKVSDFGLSRLGPTCTLQSHVSTVVRGSFGYVDPEYYRRQKLTVKSDVYSFGVVLLEILCGRPAVVQGLPKDQVSLAQWGRKFYRSGTLSEIVDPNVKAEIAPACLKKFGEIVDRCLRCQGEERPNMTDVLWGLEFALQLQEYKDNADKEINKLNMGTQIGVVEGYARTSTSDTGGEISTVDEDDPFFGSGQQVSDNARGSY